MVSQENSVTVDKVGALHVTPSPPNQSLKHGSLTWGRAREQDVAAAVFGHEELLQQARVPQKDSARELPADREQQDEDDSFFDDPLPQPQKTYGL